MSVQVIHSDCLEALKALPDCSVDAVVTDPPYGIGFMGKEWDSFKPEVVATRVEKNRRKNVPAPNGQKSTQGACHPGAIKYDESATGNQRFQVWCQEWARECLRVLKPGGHMLVFSGARTYHRMAAGVEDAGFEVRDQIMWLYGSGFPKSLNLKGEHQGLGTALKPAHEPILVARKSLSGTVAENVSEFGTGTLNIDACRIPGAKPDTTRGAGGQNGRYAPIAAQGRIEDDGKGRWPANIIHDGSDAVLGAFPDAPGQQGDLVGHSKDRLSQGIFGDMKAARDAQARGDSGSAARFFYCAKASRSERDAGLHGLPASTAGEATDRQDGSAGLNSPRAGAGAGRTGGARNTHPTVKPLALMRYLCRLVTPQGGVVLDPFAGSGTTGLAASQEGFHAILIEREQQYIDLIHARLQGDAPLFAEVHA